MTFVIILVAGLVAIAFPASLPVHPGALAIVSGERIESLDCRESQSSDTALEAARPSRTATFRIAGSYDCHRPIFALNDREPFLERLIEVESAKAKRVAASLLPRLRGIDAPVSFRVNADSPEIEQVIAALYRAELVGVLGAGRVAHLSGGDAVVPYLQIDVRRLDAPDLMTRVQLITKTEKGEKLWLEL